MALQFVKIGNTFIALEHIKCVAMSPMQTRAIIYLGDTDLAMVTLRDEEAKAFLEFMVLRTLDLTPPPELVEEAVEEEVQEHPF